MEHLIPHVHFMQKQEKVMIRNWIIKSLVLAGMAALAVATGMLSSDAKQPVNKPVKRTNVWPADAKRIEYLSKADNTMQPAYYYSPGKDEAVPLIVGLHTWSGNLEQVNTSFFRYAKEHGWAMIYPNFRGPNWTPEACGSDLVVGDIVSAVEYVKSVRKIDTNRVYLMGSSGGGYLSLLMASRHPEIWAGVCAWVGIADLAAWHAETKARKMSYYQHLEKACGGAPGTSPEVDAQYKHRSAITWADGAKSVPLSINHGIHDGHTGSVPVSHSLNFFNKIVPQEKQISAADITYIVDKEAIPESLSAGVPVDPSYGQYKVLFRRESGNTRLTIFEGGHSCVSQAGLDWLSRQVKGKPADWTIIQSVGSEAAEVQK